MKTATNKQRQGNRRNDFPESHVGFPERNDVTNPTEEMERVHVDLETLDISKKSGQELDRELNDQSPSTR